MSQAEIIAATGSKAVPAYYITAVAISRSWWSAAREIACGAPQWFSLKCDSKSAGRGANLSFVMPRLCSGHPRLAADDEKKHASPQSL